MKDEILQVLRMQAEGKLTTEQAAELLATLAEEAKNKREAEGSTQVGNETCGSRAARGGGGTGGAASMGDWGNAMGEAFVGIGATVRRAAGSIGEEIKNAFYREEGDNVVRMSKFDPPRGEGFSFRANSINVSAFAGVVLTRAVVEDNVINASKISGLVIVDGKFIDCEINGSSLDSVTLERGEIVDSTFHGTKCARVRLEAAGDAAAPSRIVDVEFQGTAVRDLTLVASRWEDCKLQGATLSGVTCERTTLEDVDLQGASLADVRLKDTTWEDLEIQGFRMGDVTFANCRLADVVLRGDTGNAGRMQGVTLENCTWEDSRFVGCTFEKTTIRNVALAKVEVRGVNFAGKTIDGLDEFKRAAGIA